MNRPEADPQYLDALDAISPQSIRSALALAGRCRVFSLESRWWPGMPVGPVHPRFDVLTYRSPRGLRNQRDQTYMEPRANTVGFGFVSELIMGTAHSGTHIDALAHVTCGENSEWSGGHSADEQLGDFGPLGHDAAQLRPIVARGVLLDIPALAGAEHCEAQHRIDGPQLAAAAAAHGVEMQAGDVVLVRTGQMRFWPDERAMAAVAGAGVSLDGARWLASRGAIAVGADTVQFECVPSGIEGDPRPVHVFLIKESRIPIIELVYLEQLAGAGVHEFLFVCLPLTISGATGSMVRPIAIA